MKKAIGIITVVVIGCLLFLLISSNDREQVKGGGESIKIGFITPLSGPVAFAGEVIQSAASIALEEINNSGGINGRKLEFVYEDGQFDPKETVNAYQALKSKGVTYYIVDGSPSVAAIRAQVVEDKNFIIAQAATTPNYNDENSLTCRVALTADTFGPSIAAFIDYNLKGKKVSFLVPNHEYGQGMADAIGDALQERGAEVVVKEFFEASTQDFRTNIAKLKEYEDQTDVLFIINNANSIEPMFKQLRDFNWNKPMVSDVWTIRNSQLKNMKLVEGVVFADYEYQPDKNENDSKMVAQFKKNYAQRTGYAPTYLAAATYDSVYLVKEALEKTNAGSPEEVGEYISKLESYPGLSGELSFDDDCEVERKVFFRKVSGEKIIDLN